MKLWVGFPPAQQPQPASAETRLLRLISPFYHLITRLGRGELCDLRSLNPPGVWLIARPSHAADRGVILLLHNNNPSVLSSGTWLTLSPCSALAAGGSVLCLKPVTKWTTATTPSKGSVCPTGSNRSHCRLPCWRLLALPSCLFAFKAVGLSYVRCNLHFQTQNTM